MSEPLDGDPSSDVDPHDSGTPADPLEANWDRQQINDLFDDLHHGAIVKHVQVRVASGDAPRDIATTLEQAKQWFDNGEAKAIQIRYDFDGRQWCDTLMILPDSVRIVRTSVE